ncbi:MAG: glycosyltransferase family 2 protein [Myxococcota bacterium]
MTPSVSVAIPVYNEEETLPELYRRLTDVLRGMDISYELVFVDDGSRDRSWELLRGLHADDSEHVRALRFSRNFGHHIAITAAMDAAKGDTVVLMDADLQDRPEVIPDLYAKLEEGYDVVYGNRVNKKFGFFKRATSTMFVSLMNRISSGEHSISTNIFRICRREVIDAVCACREQHRFVVGLVSWVGFDQTSIDVEHAERFAGQTKYSLWRMVRLALNSITAFSTAPLQLASWLGIIVSLCSFGLAGVWIVQKLIWDTAVEGWTSTLVVLLFLGGVQLITLGILGEYVGRTYSQIQARPLYIVSKTLGQPHEL